MNILITGRYRSGTTFFANFMKEQKNCSLYTDFLMTIYRTATDLGITSFLQPLTTRQKYVLSFHVKEERKLYKIINAECKSYKPNPEDEDFFTLKELYMNMLDSIKGKNDIVGSKVANVCQLINGKWIKNVLNETDLKIIYIYRDPRDNLLSEIKVATQFNIFRFITSYKNDVTNIGCHPRIFKLKFEDLILSTDKICSGLSKFLNTKITIPDNLTFENSSFRDVTGLLDETPCYRWQNKKYTREFIKELDYCEIILHDLIDKMGYSLSNTFDDYYEFKIRFWFKRQQLKIRIKNTMRVLLK